MSSSASGNTAGQGLGEAHGSAPGVGMPPFDQQSIDLLAINTIRTLSMDAVQKAKSGHPGTPMAMAPVVYTLWMDFLRFDPEDPIWPNRDRFILSAGHASMLLYSMLFLTQTKAIAKYEPTGKPSVTLDDLKKFRQLDSKTPGHPEYHFTTGVETTTGPLGQGVATSVGLAIAERWLASRYNTPEFKLFGYDIYSVCGDGDMMEGVSSEAASVAGHLKLGNLCWIYDSNRISIEGSTKLAFGDDVGARFKAYGWAVHYVEDANDCDEIRRAVAKFRDGDRTRPTMIIVTSHIGYGSPNKQDTKEAHGEPLGEDEVKAAKRFYNFPEDQQFFVPDGVLNHISQSFSARNRELRDDWNKSLEAYKEKHPDKADELHRILRRELPDGWDKDLPVFEADPKGVASRDSSGKVLNQLAKNVPWLLGGSADLAPSTKTRLTFEGAGDFSADDYAARNFHFGVREHAMGSILNGMTLSGLKAYGSGFLIFSDYMKPPIRLAALMELPVIFVFTHDSIGVGEDGPTHQPIEQLISLRAVPGLITMRPADANEVVEAWRVIMQQTQHPVAMALSRQPLPTLDRQKYAPASGVAKGAYILADAKDGTPKVILMATGSEVSLCVEIYEKLTAEGIGARVVSMPSWELFEQQDEAYRHEVLPPSITARVSVEQGGLFGWDRYVGLTGARIGMSTFGASAPLKDLLTKFGFTADKVYEAAKKQLAIAEHAQ